MAEFVEEFNVQTSTRATYKSFIEKFRTRLGQSFSHNRPVLPNQVKPPSRWFDILLRTNNRVIRPRFQLDNLYLIGYQMESPQQWLEFGNTDSALIPNSKALGFDGSYTDLAKRAQVEMEAITLGQQQLINAVNDLATSTIIKDRAKSLIVVIQMICESIRFTTISERLNLRFLSPGSQITTWMLNLERSWGNLSNILLSADKDPKQKFQFPSYYLPVDPISDNTSSPTPTYQITTLEQAANVLGILLGPVVSARVPHMAVNDEQFYLGRPLVEVLSVHINNIDRENLYGTITVTDGLDSQYIYNRRKENPESIKPGDNALLIGPAQSISAYGSFTINLLLKDDKEDEVSNGEIWWNVYNTTNEYDKPLFRNIDGKYGSLTVNYIVLSDAVAASVEVTLIKRDQKNTADVYGQLTATNGNFGDSKSVLFQKASDDNIKVIPGQLIPLSRSVVAVPLNSSLVVGANLYDHDVDAEIANGTAEFPARLSGTVKKSIFGKVGEIQVKVTWI